MSVEETTHEEIDSHLEADFKFKHFTVTLSDGQSIAALINGDIGWLMYLRDADDIGFSTRNPEFSDAEGMMEFVLENGQGDEYPTFYTYGVSDIRKALHEFVDKRRLPAHVMWHDDRLTEE